MVDKSQFDYLRGYNYSLKNLWLRIESLDKKLPLLMEGAIKDMMSKLIILPLPFKKCFPAFCRITINRRLKENNNERITETKWLGYKPSCLVDSYGRMNLIGQSILYGTFSVPTAINELLPKPGDLVTLSEWTLKQQNTELLVYPIFWKMRESRSYFQILNQYRELITRFDKEIQSLYDTQMQFIAEVMSKPIKPENNNLYVFTSSIANRILNLEMNGEVEAIVYPSVKNSCRMDNIALKPDSFDEKYTLTSVREYQIQLNSDELKMNLVLGHSSKFENGKIIWNI